MSAFARVNQKVSNAWLDFFVRLAQKAQEDGEGQTFMEYGIIAGVVAIAVIALVIQYGDKVAQWWHRLISSM